MTTPTAQQRTVTPSRATWRFTDRYGKEVTGSEIELYWEVHCDPISDDWTPHEIDAVALFRMWWQRYGNDDLRVYGLAEDYFPIFWYVQFSGRPGFEGAPFCRMHERLCDAYDYRREHFLNYFTWPVGEQTGERLRWSELPVVDKLWNAERAEKGGFIQEATGWKPAAYQESVDVRALAAMAGISL